MHTVKCRAFVLVMLGLYRLARAGGGSNKPAPAAGGTVSVAGVNFNESTILADIYGKALEAKGYTVTYKTKLGNRQIVEPALASGQIDFYPGYAASELEFLHKYTGETTGDPQSTTDKRTNTLRRPSSYRS